MNIATQFPAARGMIRTLGLGRMAYKTWHAPRAFLKELRRQGPINKYFMHRGMKHMEAHAHELCPLDFCLADEAVLAPEIHFLTGKKYWYQTAYCAYTMAKHGGMPVRPVIYDDGTMEEVHLTALRRLFPHLKYYSRAIIEARIERVLPESRYPALRERRINYPHIRKLTDVHAGSDGWKLVLDSDMLFFKRPDFMLDWLKRPQLPCYMVDVENSYGYSEELMEELCGSAVPRKVNVGIIGLRSEEIDWDEMERWTAEMLRREGSSYLQEQGLTAMLLAGRRALRIPPRDYACMPPEPEACNPSVILHHYVADSKSAYFRYNWKQAHNA